MPVGRDVGLLRSMDAILEVQTPAGSFRNYWLHCPNLYLSDLQTGDVVPCDPIARAFEEKDGSDVRFWEKFELAGFHFA